MRLSKWFALFGKDDDADRYVDSVGASREGTEKPPPGAESEIADDDSMTAIPRRHDDGSFPFPHRLNQQRSSDDGAHRPSWWRIFYR